MGMWAPTGNPNSCTNTQLLASQIQVIPLFAAMVRIYQPSHPQLNPMFAAAFIIHLPAELCFGRTLGRLPICIEFLQQHIRKIENVDRACMEGCTGSDANDDLPRSYVLSFDMTGTDWSLTQAKPHVVNANRVLAVMARILQRWM